MQMKIEMSPPTRKTLTKTNSQKIVRQSHDINQEVSFDTKLQTPTETSLVYDTGQIEVENHKRK